MVLVGCSKHFNHGRLLRRQDDAVRVDPANHTPGDKWSHVTQVEVRGRGERLVLVPSSTAGGQDKTMTWHFTVG